jgi:hypothetical protein
MTDAELIRCVRAQIAVDRAVNTYQRKSGEAIFIPPSETRTP